MKALICMVLPLAMLLLTLSINPACQVDRDAKAEPRSVQHNEESPGAMAWRTTRAEVARLKSLDQEISPPEKDFACEHDAQCTVMDKGCCYGEKRLAINSDAALQWQRSLNQGCLALLKDKKNRALCHQRKFFVNRQNEHARCIDQRCQLQ